MVAESVASADKANGSGMRITKGWVLAVAIAGAACGTGSGEPDAGSDGRSATPSELAAGATTGVLAAPVPCDLLTPADIESVIGDAVSGPEPDGVECAFRRQPGPDGLRRLAVRLRLEVSEGTPSELFERYTAAIRQAIGGDYDPEVFGGLGSIAAWDGDALLTSIPVENSRSAFVVIQLTGVDAAVEREQAGRLAAIALDAIRRPR